MPTIDNSKKSSQGSGNDSGKVNKLQSKILTVSTKLDKAYLLIRGEKFEDANQVLTDIQNLLIEIKKEL